MKVRQVMTPDATWVSTDTTLTEAARLMQELNVGALPVVEDEELAGLITDRDIVVRAIAQGRNPSHTNVHEAMSSGLLYIYEDQEADEAAKLMELHSIRRLPVLNRDRKLAGMISLGDLAVETEPDVSGEILRHVSSPASPSR